MTRTLETPDNEDFQDNVIASPRLRGLFLDLENKHLALLDDYDRLQRDLNTIKGLFTKVQSIVIGERKDG